MADRFTIALPPNNRGEREYVSRWIFEEQLGMACEFVSTVEPRTIIAGADGASRIVIPDVLFNGADGCYLHHPADMPAPRLRPGILAPPLTDGAADVVAPYALPAAHEAATSEGDTISLTFDVLAAVFFMLTRMEEVIGDERDHHGRFPSSASWAVRNGVEQRPIVDEWVALLRGCCERLWPGATRSTATYRLAPSHDVDHPFLYHGLPSVRRWHRLARKVSGDLTIRWSILEARRSVAAYWRFRRGGADADPYFTLRELMTHSERRGLRSTFYLIVHPGLPVDGRPYLDQEPIARAAREIIDRGHEIGLHASYQTMGNPRRAMEEAGTLRRFLERLGAASSSIGVRHHYLRWSAREHWAMWSDADLSFDATLGYGDRVGFRCGTCHEFPVFDLERRRPLALRERPLVVMDAAVCPGRAVGSASARRRHLDLLKVVAERCRAHRGTFELLWHNTHLQTRLQRSMYLDVLDCCGPTVTTAES